MSDTIELCKKGRGFLPASEDAADFHRRFTDGEVISFEQIEERDAVRLRNYWKLCELCAEHCERVMLPSGKVLEIRGKEDASNAIKILVGHTEPILDADGQPIFVILKSIAFRSMKQKAWEDFWERALRAVAEHILPGVPEETIQTELLKCMGWAK